MFWMKPAWPLYFTQFTGEESRCLVDCPSPRGDDYLAIVHERDGKSKSHEYAPLQNIHFIICSTLPRTKTSPFARGKGQKEETCAED